VVKNQLVIEAYLGNNSMLEIEKINVSYGDLQALWDISFKVEEKEIVALIAQWRWEDDHTQIHLWLLRPFAGEIRFEGLAMEKMAIHKRVEMGYQPGSGGRGFFPE